MKIPLTLSTCLVAAMMLVSAPGCATTQSMSSAPKEFFVYFGTYTRAPSKGIYRAKFDVTTGRLSPAELAVECRNPSFLALHPNGKFLYAVEEGVDSRREAGRGVGAYALDATSGGLTFLNYQSCSGSDACHISVDPSGRMAHRHRQTGRAPRAHWRRVRRPYRR